MILEIKKIIKETTDTKSFVLEDTGNDEVHYKSGQFLTFQFSNRNDEEVRRSYSLSSSPELGEPLTITVKRIANGAFSRQLHDIFLTGDKLQSIGASGFFTLPENINAFDQLIFFAAGSGIVPVYGMIKTALHKHSSIPVVLIYSNKNEKHTIFYNELKTLSCKFPGRFKIEFLFSSSPDLETARLNLEYVEKLFNKYASSSSRQRVLYYLCGPYDYMRMITIKLLVQGVSQENIRKEIFYVQKSSEKLLPPDTQPHQVILNIHDRTHSFISSYPSTILQTAKRNGFPIPYSCEAGQCGTCAATCISGEVWMSHNEVLLDDEIAKGRVLTCTGYAVGGDVELKI